MKFHTETWTIERLIDFLEKDKIDLSPPYQRNFIWSKSDQKELINSIIEKKYPIPNFFLRYDDERKKYEMVDGQQRTRTIYGFFKSNIRGVIKELDDPVLKEFLEFELTFVFIDEVDENESIEEFYARVNKTGRKLNKPELYKAEYFYTEFLALNEELAGCEEFAKLDIFTATSINRMNDIDFVSELVALLVFGISDKKDKVIDLYENDISLNQKEDIKTRFRSILTIVNLLDLVYPIRKSRFRQRNDFYTLFGFINRFMNEFNPQSFVYYYKVLILISEDISPSNEFCRPLKDYAINCVSQSNSKKARINREKFFIDLFINNKSEPTSVQSDLLEYYELTASDLIRIDNYFTISLNSIQNLKTNILNE